MRTLANGLLWGGAGLALLAATQPWWTAVERAGVSGAQATSGAALALVLAALAGAFLSRFLRGPGRRIVTAVVAVLLASGLPIALTAAVPAALPGSNLDETLAVAATPWRWVYAGSVGLAAAGAVLLLFSPAPKLRAASTPDPALDAWKALDAGVDPTTDTGRATGGDVEAKPQE